MNIYGEYFYGNKISDYGLQNGYVDYGTLAKAFDAVLNNNIYNIGWELGEWEQESGFVDNSEEIEELEERAEELEERAEADAEAAEELEAVHEKIKELEAEQEDEPEIYQFYIVDARGAEILKEAGEIVFYNEALNMYLWGVTHWGTSWDYVLTNIPCNTGEF